MKNFISINAKHYKKNEIKRIINHNVRLEEPTYILDKEHIKYKNVDIIYQNKKVNAYDFQDPKSNNLKNLNLFLNKEQIAKALNEQYDLLINTKEGIQKARKSYTKKNEATLVEFVVAISHEQTKEYLDNKVDITKGFNKIVDNLQKKYGFTPLHLSLHLDEGHIDIDTNEVKHNYHAHITMLNFDFEKEKVVLRTLKKQDFSMLQDLAQDSFQEVGLDYKRGLNKNLTGNEHLERNMFISKKLNSKINSQHNLINSQHNLLKIQREEIAQNINLINTKKNEHKELLKNYDKDSNEYQDLYEKIGGFQELEKNLRKQHKQMNVEIKALEEKIKTFNIDDKEELLRKLNNSINKIVDNNTKTSTFKKVTYDTQKIIEDFKDLGKKLVNSNINIKNHEELVKKLEEKDKIIEEKDKIIENKDSIIEKVATEKYEAIRENNVLKQNKAPTSQKELEKDKILNQTNKMLSKANMKLKTMHNVLKDNGIKLNKENVAKAKGIETTKQKKLREQEYKYSTIDR